LIKGAQSGTLKALLPCLNPSVFVARIIMDFLFIPSPAGSKSLLHSSALSPSVTCRSQRSKYSSRKTKVVAVSTSTNNTTTPITDQTEQDLYSVLGVSRDASSRDIRKAYLKWSKMLHPDVVATSSSGEDSDNDIKTSKLPTASYDKIQQAYSVLFDDELRAIYDRTGMDGVNTVLTIRERAASAPKGARVSEAIDFEEYFTAGAGGLLSAGMDDDTVSPEDPDNDSCPRSVEQAKHNATMHHDGATRYYALWWISRFRVGQAESVLVDVLVNPVANNFPVKEHHRANALIRRAALALGNVAAAPAEQNEEIAKYRDPRTTRVLAERCRSEDYFVRYRCVEALARIAMRNKGPEKVDPLVFEVLKELLQKGIDKKEREEKAASGYQHQEGMFDLDGLDPEVAEKLKKVFAARRQNEFRSKRTTMTPNLGVGLSPDDQPLEWILKAVGALRMEDCKEQVEKFLDFGIPLIKYAAHKAMYQLTNDTSYLNPIVSALMYGNEHHYSQRVLIRDLGDVGYAEAAEAIVNCGMVENSFKILALRQILAQRGYDPLKDDKLSPVYKFIDGLL